MSIHMTSSPISAEIIDEPLPKPEAPGENDAAETNARTLCDQAAVRRATELNQERRRKGPRISQNWFYHEEEASLKTRLFISLGNEGKRAYADSFPSTDISLPSFKDLHAS